MPGGGCLAYASAAGMMIRRSPPIDMPGTPRSIPLTTSPFPMVNEKGFPFLLAISMVSRKTATRCAGV